MYPMKEGGEAARAPREANGGGLVEQMENHLPEQLVWEALHHSNSRITFNTQQRIL